MYDTAPTIEDLFKDAAQNYQLERLYLAERAANREKRRDTQFDVRAQLAQAFLADPTQRALVHPPPTHDHCYFWTAKGRVRFDLRTDKGSPCRDVPAEAHRRFQADLRARDERRRQQRVADVAAREEKERAAAEWVAQHGTADQRDRLSVGMLPMEEVIEAMTAQVFAPVADRELYTRGARGAATSPPAAVLGLCGCSRASGRRGRVQHERREGERCTMGVHGGVEAARTGRMYDVANAPAVVETRSASAGRLRAMPFESIANSDRSCCAENSRRRDPSGSPTR